MLKVIKCKFLKFYVNVCNVNATIFIGVVPIYQYKISLKLHVNGFEVMQSDIDSVTTGHVRNKGHLSAQFV